MRIDHIEWAISELESLTDRYKGYAADSLQWDRVKQCEDAARLAKIAVSQITEPICEKCREMEIYKKFEAPESCYCAVTMPPCSWCTNPENSEEE